MGERGCVVEIRKASMMIMTSDCQFKEIKRQADVEEGMEVVFSPADVIYKRTKSYRSFMAAAAAVILLILSTLTLIRGWESSIRTTAILTIDINPSIELRLYDNRVIAAKALNREARGLPLKQLINKTPLEAINKAIQLAALKGYLPEAEGYVLVASVALSEDEEGLQGLESLLSELKETIEAREISGKAIHLYTVTSDKETLEKAKEQQLSVGRMEILKQIEEKDNAAVDYNAAKGREVRELVKEALEKQGTKNQEKGSKQQEREEKKSAKEEKKASKERETQREKYSGEAAKWPWERETNKNIDSEKNRTDNKAGKSGASFRKNENSSLINNREVKGNKETGNGSWNNGNSRNNNKDNNSKNDNNNKNNNNKNKNRNDNRSDSNNKGNGGNSPNNKGSTNRKIP